MLDGGTGLYDLFAELSIPFKCPRVWVKLFDTRKGRGVVDWPQTQEKVIRNKHVDPVLFFIPLGSRGLLLGSSRSPAVAPSGCHRSRPICPFQAAEAETT